ncbi:MAG: hypothetical protein IPJ88_06410 [Myxococcales bacterium]|nr:MAG: hypothetical protein IPJ88_06410 [Myxococcales bacterium]
MKKTLVVVAASVLSIFSCSKKEPENINETSLEQQATQMKEQAETQVNAMKDEFIQTSREKLNNLRSDLRTLESQAELKKVELNAELEKAENSVEQDLTAIEKSAESIQEQSKQNIANRLKELEELIAAQREKLAEQS